VEVNVENESGASAPPKDTNPKDEAAIAEGRLQLSCVPWRALPRMPNTPAEWCVMSEVALAMTEGAWKYGRHNYRVAGVRASVYVDAFMRHMMAREMGEHLDPDSGQPHLVKAFSGLLVLQDCIMSGGPLFVDDRPPYALCAEAEAATEEWGSCAIESVLSWWDCQGEHAFLGGAITWLLETRAREIEMEWFDADVSHVGGVWRGSYQAGAKALRDRLGDRPVAPPFTAK
jgi:hypothetical protein